MRRKESKRRREAGQGRTGAPVRYMKSSDKGKYGRIAKKYKKKKKGVNADELGRQDNGLHIRSVINGISSAYFTPIYSAM